MRDVRIEPKEQGKGRTFLATCLATVEADGLWDGGTTSDDVRPVWAMFAGSDQELRPFMANLVGGRKVLIGDRTGYRRKNDRMEFLRSVGYQMSWQREEEGSVVTIFAPDLFRMDPGMVDPKGAMFVLLPPSRWSADQKIDVAPIVKHVVKLNAYPFPADALRDLVPMAFLFCAYLDRRTRCPLVSDGRFYLQVMLACLANGLASWSTSDRSTYGERPFGVHGHLRYREEDTASVGLNPGLAFQADHESLEKLLAEQVDVFFTVTRGK